MILNACFLLPITIPLVVSPPWTRCGITAQNRGHGGIGNFWPCCACPRLGGSPTCFSKQLGLPSHFNLRWNLRWETFFPLSRFSPCPSLEQATFHVSISLPSISLPLKSSLKLYSLLLSLWSFPLSTRALFSQSRRALSSLCAHSTTNHHHFCLVKPWRWCSSFFLKFSSYLFFRQYIIASYLIFFSLIPLF